MNLLSNALDTLFQKMPLGVAIFNRDLTLRNYNPMWVQYVTTYTPLTATVITPQMNLFELLPQTEALLQRPLERVLAGQTVELFGVQFVIHGRIFFWDIELIPAQEQGEIIGFIFVAKDITEQRRTKRELQAAENALLTLMSNLPGMAYRAQHNPQRVMELVNAGAFELTGYPSTTFVSPEGVHFIDLIHEDDRNATLKALDAAVAAKQSYELIYRIRTKFEEVKWVMERGAPVFGPSGEIVALEGFISDITERVLSQQLLERRVLDRTRKLSALYEVMEVAAERFQLSEILEESLARVLKAVHAQAGAIQLLNEERTTLYLAAAQKLGDLLEAQWGRQAADEGLAGIVVQSGQAQTLLSLTAEADPPLNECGWETYAGLPMHARGHLVGVLTVLRAQRRTFSEEDTALLNSVADQIGAAVENAYLRHENERLVVVEERNRLARELHDAVTHTLYSLNLFAETTKRFAQAGDLGKVIQYTDRIQTSAQDSLREMRLLLHNLRPSILEEAGLVGALQQRLEAVEKRSGVTYRLVADENLELPALVEEALFHIAEEALNNALKHAGGSAVTVRLQHHEQQILLSIADNGCGIDPLCLTQNGGLGLTSMRERAELLGGRLAIELAEPCGTMVTAIIDLEKLPNRKLLGWHGGRQRQGAASV